MTSRSDHYDIVIVGGGSAGCVLAARMSEEASLRVLLIEAGADTPQDRQSQALKSRYPGRAYFDPANLWNDLAVHTGGLGGSNRPRRPVAYAQGRLLGGGSAINGIGANRGAPADYDEWGEAGASGWSWDAVLPYFRKLERDLDITDPYLHGTDGPIPVRRIPPERWSGFAHAVAGALGERGFSLHQDQNGPWLDGIHPTSTNLDEGWERVSTARGYLDRAVRARANLTILADAEVLRIVFTGRRAGGVEVREASGNVTLIAAKHEVVLCAGAIHTPALLMKSGVGPAQALRDLGVAPIHDAPGVGRNLLEHPSSGVICHLPARSRLPVADEYHIPAILRYSSGLAGCPQGDMHMAIVGRAAWHAVGRRMGLLFFWVNKSYSSGVVSLRRQADGSLGVHVDFRMLADERDRVRLSDAFRLGADVLRAVEKQGASARVLPARLSDRARRFGFPNLRNAALTGMAAMLLDLSGPLAGALLERMVGDDVDVERLLADEAALDAFLDGAVTGVWHACGTCRMGAEGDPLAVTDGEGRVNGLQGLRVCDASLFPTIPAANINVPVIMVAERLADFMKAQFGLPASIPAGSTAL
ncbi:GMC family oxidoreductase [Labrys neptuniae]